MLPVVLLLLAAHSEVESGWESAQKQVGQWSVKSCLQGTTASERRLTFAHLSAQLSGNYAAENVGLDTADNSTSSTETVTATSWFSKDSNASEESLYEYSSLKKMKTGESPPSQNSSVSTGEVLHALKSTQFAQQRALTTMIGDDALKAAAAAEETRNLINEIENMNGTEDLKAAFNRDLYKVGPNVPKCCQRWWLVPLEKRWITKARS